MNRIKHIGLLLAAVLVSSCADEQVEEISIRKIRTMSVDLGSQSSQRTFNGQAQTDKTVNLSFRSSGIITKFDIQLGQHVNKGDLLAELDNVSARLSYEQTVSSLYSAKSELDTSELNLKRVRNLYEKGGSSLSDYENAKNSYRTARSSYESAQRSVEIQQDQIQFGKIYAPETGLIASVSKEVDENASVAETVAVLNAGSDMVIRVGLPESVINLVQQSTKVSISFAAIANEVFSGEVSEISPSIDLQTATYPVRVKLLGDTQSIRSGMAATVNFDFTDLDNAIEKLLVPAAAVGEDSNGRFVFIVENQSDDISIVRKRSIEIGRLVDDAFEVLSGLEVGDNIVTAGVHSVLDGQQVKM